jgi:hypothetical protein
VTKALTIPAGLALLGWALWEQMQFTGSRQPKEQPTFCAWRIWRTGADCTNPTIPVFGQTCGPVCVGAQRREARAP